MTDELTLAPYQRRHAGPRGEFILREHDTLPNLAARAILRRRQPGWSQFNCGYRIEERTNV
jgi:hypothetical protein